MTEREKLDKLFDLETLLYNQLIVTNDDINEHLDYVVNKQSVQTEQMYQLIDVVRELKDIILEGLDD